MLWCQGAQGIRVFNRKLKSTLSQPQGLAQFCHQRGPLNNKHHCRWPWVTFTIILMSSSSSNSLWSISNKVSVSLIFNSPWNSGPSLPVRSADKFSIVLLYTNMHMSHHCHTPRLCWFLVEAAFTLLQLVLWHYTCKNLQNRPLRARHLGPWDVPPTLHSL